MKKSLLALAVLGAFAGAAQAQTNVTIYGSFDGGVRYMNKVNAAGDSRTTVSSNGTYNSNRLGFRGTEDLGGGLKANFQLETGFNTGNGALDTNLFHRTATVGLSGSWGALNIGHQYSVSFDTIGLYDPFAYKYTGIIPLATQGGLTRISNSVKYTGAFGPVAVRAQYGFGEQAGDSGSGSTRAIGASYSAGGLTVGAAYTGGERAAGNTLGAASTNAGTLDMTNWTIGAAYATSSFRVAAGYADHSQERGAGLADNDITNWWLGGSYNLSPTTALSAAFYRTKAELGAQDAERDLFIIGATYALSKRTNFYAAIDYSRYDGNTAALNGNGGLLNAFGAMRPDDKQTGFSIGINHLF